MLDVLIFIGWFALMVVVFTIVFMSLLSFMVVFPKMYEDLRDVMEKRK